MARGICDEGHATDRVAELVCKAWTEGVGKQKLVARSSETPKRPPKSSRFGWSWTERDCANRPRNMTMWSSLLIFNSN